MQKRRWNRSRAAHLPWGVSKLLQDGFKDSMVKPSSQRINGGRRRAWIPSPCLLRAPGRPHAGAEGESTRAAARMVQSQPRHFECQSAAAASSAAVPSAATAPGTSPRLGARGSRGTAAQGTPGGGKAPQDPGWGTTPEPAWAPPQANSKSVLGQSSSPHQCFVRDHDPAAPVGPSPLGHPSKLAVAAHAGLAGLAALQPNATWTLQIHQPAHPHPHEKRQAQRPRSRPLQTSDSIHQRYWCWSVGRRQVQQRLMTGPGYPHVSPVACPSPRRTAQHPAAPPRRTRTRPPVRLLCSGAQGFIL